MNDRLQALALDARDPLAPLQRQFTLPDGEIKDFTGINAPYDAPEHPALEIRTAEMTVEVAVETVFRFLLPHITIT